MTALDWTVLIIVFASMMIGIWRGAVRELFAIAAWVAGIACAWTFGDTAARVLSGWIATSGIRIVLGYFFAFLMAYIVIALIGVGVRALLHASGLTFLDRGIGTIIGGLRGVLVVLIVAVIVGMTPLPRETWWRDAVVAPMLETSVLVVKQWLPENVAKRISFPRGATQTVQINSDDAFSKFFPVKSAFFAPQVLIVLYDARVAREAA